MKGKNFLKLSTTFIVSFIMLSSCNSNKNLSKVKLSNQNDTISYYLGLDIGRSIARLELEDINYNALIKGMDQILKKDTTAPAEFIVQMYLNDYFTKAYEKKIKEQYKDNIEKNENFLEENKKKEGIVTLPSGLQYEILKEGKGPKPQSNDIVEVHYKGYLIDSTVFDNSYDRKESVKFNVNGVIRGFSEALQLMPVGSKWRIYIPSELGYGSRSSENIPPYSTLIFELELLDIVSEDTNNK